MWIFYPLLIKILGINQRERRNVRATAWMLDPLALAT